MKTKIAALYLLGALLLSVTSTPALSAEVTKYTTSENNAFAEFTSYSGNFYTYMTVVAYESVSQTKPRSAHPSVPLLSVSLYQYNATTGELLHYGAGYATDVTARFVKAKTASAQGKVVIDDFFGGTSFITITLDLKWNASGPMTRETQRTSVLFPNGGGFQHYSGNVFSSVASCTGTITGMPNFVLNSTVNVNANLRAIGTGEMTVIKP